MVVCSWLILNGQKFSSRTNGGCKRKGRPQTRRQIQAAFPECHSARHGRKKGETDYNFWQLLTGQSRPKLDMLRPSSNFLSHWVRPWPNKPIEALGNGFGGLFHASEGVLRSVMVITAVDDIPRPSDVFRRDQKISDTTDPCNYCCQRTRTTHVPGSRFYALRDSVDWRNARFVSENIDR